MDTIEFLGIDKALSLKSVSLLAEYESSRMSDTTETRKSKKDKTNRHIKQQVPEPTDESFAGITPPTKRARTSYDVFVEHELRVILGEAPSIEAEIPEFVSLGLLERWRSMSCEESQLYAELLEVEAMTAKHNAGNSDFKDAVKVSSDPKGIFELHGLTPSFRSALTKFLLKPGDIRR